MLPVGKRFVGRSSIIKVFGWGWVIRYLALIPALFAPYFALKGQPGIGLLLLILSTAGFHIARGIAMIGNNPVLGLLSSGGGDKPRSDQGRYLANISVINSVAAILANIVIAFLLGQDATLWRYAIAVGIGIATGLASCVFLFKTPEPDAFSSKDDVSIAKVT